MRAQLITFLSSFLCALIGVALLVMIQIAWSVTSDPARCQTSMDCSVGGHSVATSTLVRPLPFLPEPPSTLIKKGLTAASVFALDDETGVVLFDVSSTVARPLASLTKMMSAIILTELPMSWSATTTILEVDSDGSNSHIKVGESYSAAILWQTALIGSSNTAISALVRMSGLTNDQFVALMNAKARRLAMPSLYFVEPTGLDPRNVGTARDVARLLHFALINDAIRPVLGQEQVVLYPPKQPSRVVWNTNWLLTKWVPHTFADRVVGKTGYIGDSGYNLAVRLVGANARVIRVVIMGAALPESRFIEARTVGEWVFNHAVWPDFVASSSFHE